LDIFVNTVQNTKVLESGFALLVSADGHLLAMPSTWNPAVYIFDYSYTGITTTQWDQILLLGSADNYTFNDVNGTMYLLTKSDVTPDNSDLGALYYVLLCANQSEAQVPIGQINSKFDKTYYLIFYITMGISGFTSVTILILIYFSLKRLQNQLQIIEKVFESIINRSILPNVTTGISFEKVERNSSGVESLVEVCNKKLKELVKKEKQFQKHPWGLTRPNDTMISNEWDSHLYPQNACNYEHVPWKRLFLSFSKII
jgi:hypothetical protein